VGGQLISLTKQQITRLSDALDEWGFQTESVPGALFAAKKGMTSVVAYETGDVLVQDPDGTELLRAIVRTVVLGDQPTQNMKLQQFEGLRPDIAAENGYIGTDESGKGDYFGPLVIAGVYLTYSGRPLLGAWNVRDSKEMSDEAVLHAALQIKARFTHYVVAIGPEKYNQLYEQMKNLNRILAWGHARVIENILEKVECKEAITDKFGDERYVQRALMQKGKQIRLVQRPKAESDIAVAAASVLARAEFLRRLEKLSKTLGTKLPKGSSERVEQVARHLVSRLGKEVLHKAAKFHFKTTQYVLGQISRE